MAFTHASVLLRETLDTLAPQAGEKVCDVTLGLGGHALAFLERIGPKGHLTGIDADAKNLAMASERLAAYDNVSLHHGNFRNVADCLPQSVDVLFGDLGLSSPHVDDGERGMSFRFDAPLDMRFDRDSGRTAAELIHNTPDRELMRIFAVYGEVPRVAALVTLLKKKSPQTTVELNACVEELYRWQAKQHLPQVYQALRMAVNDECGALEALLAAVPELILPGGRVGIMSYHSLEDRLVKHTFKAWCEDEVDPLTGRSVRSADWELVTRKAIVPSAEEIALNPRARSAKLRVVRRRS